MQINNKKKFRSAVVSKNRNPVWMQEFTFIRVADRSSLVINVFDEGTVKPEAIGTVAIPISAVKSQKGGRLSGVWKLQNISKGSICLDLAWLPYDDSRKPFYTCDS